MDKNIYEKELSKIRKLHRRDSLILELELYAYEEHNIYFRLGFDHREKACYLAWYDLDTINNPSKSPVKGREYLSFEESNFLFLPFENREGEYIDEITEKRDDNIVRLDIYYNGRNFHYAFYDFIPRKLSHLARLFSNLFEHMPKKLEPFLYKLYAILTDTTMKYLYQKEFSFDLKEDPLNSIFPQHLLEKGEKYYNEGKLVFLEQIDNHYLGIIEGREKYLVIIDNNEEEKKIKVSCSCPCEFYCKHVCTVILGIRNNLYHPFYKIVYNDNSLSPIEKILTFNYELCLGIIDSHFLVASLNGNFEMIPIFDQDDNCYWSVFEDDTDHSLTKKLEKLIEEKKRINVRC